MTLSSHCSCFVAHNNADAPSSRFRHSCHFHDRGGPVPISPHQKLARVEGTQCRAMAHAEYGRLREPLAHQSIEPRLRSLVNRRGRLIKEEQIGLLHERAREGDALLLAGGKLERPMTSLTETTR